MEKFNYLNNGVKDTEFIPQDYENLKRIFSDPLIVLKDNEGWLANFNDKEVNIIELQKVFYEIYELSYFDFKKLTSVLEVKEPQELNDVIRYINNLDKYVLINEFDVYHDDTKLAKTIYYHMNKTTQHHDKSFEWKEFGDHIRHNYTSFLTKQGWLFEVLAPSLDYDKNEIFQVNRPFESYEFEIRLDNGIQHTTIKLPLSKERLSIELDLLELNADTDFQFNINNQNDYKDFYEEMSLIIKNSFINDTNEFAEKMQGLSLYELSTLKAALEIIPTDDISEINYIIDNLESFELIDIENFNPNNYVQDKLIHLSNTDFNEFEKTINEYFDYERYYKDLENTESLIETNEGVLKVNEDFKTVIDFEQKM